MSKEPQARPAETNSAPPIDPEKLSVQDQLALFELLEKKEAKKKRDEAEAAFQAARKTVMAAQVAGWEAEEAKRASCPHTKPSGRSAIAGQKLHSHDYLWICQYCSKTWKNDQLPAHLRIDSDRVGGPQF